MKRFYDTMKRGQVVVESSTTIIDTDERVSNFFQPTPDGYRKAYTVDGLPFNELIPLPTSEEVQARLDGQSLIESERVKTEALNNMTVAVTSGKVFYVDSASRADIADAIAIGEDENQTTTSWKLAVEINGTKWNTVTIAEMKEARKKGLELKGSIIA